MARGIARTVLVVNLTRGTETETTQGGTVVCKLSVAVNAQKKDGRGEWVDHPSFFDVKVFGAQAENAARYLAKGRQVAIEGRLEQQRREAQDGTKRSRIEIIADNVMYLGTGEQKPQQQAPADAPYSGPMGAEDDIPF